MAAITCFWVERLADDRFIRAGTGEVKQHGTEFPPGAIFDISAGTGRVESDHQHFFKQYPDKMVIAVMTPGGAWIVDGPSYSQANGHRMCPWTRSGDPRQPSTFSITPSINMNEEKAKDHYHGILSNGILRDA